jgi:hypothetical protein
MLSPPYEEIESIVPLNLSITIKPRSMRVRWIL